MAYFQVWLVKTFLSVKPVGALMHSRWGWPAAESIHFIGLSLLVGTIMLLDLRLLGMAKRIPIAAVHRLVPWGLAGWGLNFVSGLGFLLAEPDQYVFNPSFHFKMLFMALAGANALAFYVTSSARAMQLPPGAEAPRRAKTIAAVSICLWVAIIVCGRLLTFYRPGVCGPEGPGVLAECIPRIKL